MIINELEKSAFDVMFDMQKAPFSYDDADFALRTYLQEFDFSDYFRDTENIDDNVDVFCKMIIDKKLEECEFKTAQRYIIGFCEACKHIEDIRAAIGRENSDTQDGMIAALRIFAEGLLK